MPRALVVLVLLAATLAFAAPPGLKAAIARGRALVKKNDFAGAVKAYQEALVIAPDDATALSELGLAALRGKDLELAEKASRRSVAVAASPALRAASLYNLGRVHEARGDKAAALDAYRRSLEDRPNDTVRARLVALDPLAGGDPLAPRLMAGPYASTADFCRKGEQKQECARRGDPEARTRPTFACAPLKAALPRPPAPYQGFEAFTSTCTEEEGTILTEVHLAVKVGGGWWIVDVEATLDTARQSDSAELGSVEVKDVVAGGAPELLVRSSASFDYRGINLSEVESLRVVGVGASGKPSATPAILVEQIDEENDDEGNTLSRDGAAFDVSFPAGQLELSGPVRVVGKGLSRETLKGLVGRHPLAFP